MACQGLPQTRILPSSPHLQLASAHLWFIHTSCPSPALCPLVRENHRGQLLTACTDAAATQPRRFDSSFAARPSCVGRTSLDTTEQARAPQVRHSSPHPAITLKSISPSVFPAPSPPPSGSNIGRVFRRIDRIQFVVQPVGLIVELPSTTHGPTPARTWTGRTPGRTLLGAPQSLRRRHPRRHTV